MSLKTQIDALAVRIATEIKGKATAAHTHSNSTITSVDWSKITNIPGNLASSVSWVDVLSKPTTVAGFGITDINSYAPSLTGAGASGAWGIDITGESARTLKVVSPDSRSTVETPESKSAGFYADFKQNGVAGLNDGGGYTGVLTFRPYGNASDWTGGNSFQFGATQNDNIWHRSGSSVTWGAWKKFLDSVNYTEYAVSKDTAQTITASHNFTSTALHLSGHMYHNTFGGTNVYVHYYPSGQSSISAANLRVRAETDYKTLYFSGDGTLSWDGHQIITMKNLGTAVTTTAADSKLWINNDDGGWVPQTGTKVGGITAGTAAQNYFSFSSAAGYLNVAVDGTVYVSEGRYPVWHAGIFNPADYLKLNNPSATGVFLLYSTTAAANFSQADGSYNAHIKVPANQNAILSFEREGQYAIKLGLRTDNSVTIGGWSDTERISFSSDGDIWTKKLGYVSSTFLQDTNLNSHFTKSITIPGSTGYFYPVLIENLTAGGRNGGMYDLTIARSHVHTDGSWMGSYEARITGSISSWGNIVGKVLTYYQQSGSGNFIWGLGDANSSITNNGLIVWLRGGMTHEISSNLPTMQFQLTGPTNGTLTEFGGSVNQAIAEASCRFYDKMNALYIYRGESDSFDRVLTDTTQQMKVGHKIVFPSAGGNYLAVGGTGKTNENNATYSSIAATSGGNLHIDAGSGGLLCLNYYDGASIAFGSGEGSHAAWMSSTGQLYKGNYGDAASQPYWHEGNQPDVNLFKRRGHAINITTDLGHICRYSAPGAYQIVTESNVSFPVPVYTYGTLSKFDSGDSAKSAMYISHHGDVCFTGCWGTDLNGWYTAWTTKNFNPSNYLPKTGGILTGATDVIGTLQVRAPDDAAGIAKIALHRPGYSLVELTSSGNELSVSCQLSVAGDISNGTAKFRGNAIEQVATASHEAEIAINYYGYSSGTAYFRDFSVYDGKGAKVLFVDGSEHSTTFYGPITSTGNITAYSDIKLKDNLEVIQSARSKLHQINGYTYDRIDINERQAGLIAQEVEIVLPEVVTERDGIKGINYGAVSSLLVEAIKDIDNSISQELAELRETVAKQAQLIEFLMNKIKE
jgi:hypothetical protein